jgi:integrase
MARRALTDRTIKAIKPARAGKRSETWDAIVPSLGVRVTDTGAKSFVLATRYPGSHNPTRRSLGAYGELTLEQARTKARQWLALIQRGIDPAEEEERKRLAEDRKRANSFAAVAEDFIRTKLPSERRGAEVERAIRREFIPAWGKRPVTDITALDVLAIIRPIKERAPYLAHNTLGYAKRLFSWAIDQHVYGLETSPCDRLKPKKIIGERKPRQRVLSDEELFAFWRAASRMPYPYGPLLRMLLLTGQRHSDVAGAPWSEISLDRAEWIIASGRFKSDTSHLIPLTDDTLAILRALPRFRGGTFVFTTTGGEKPTDIRGWAKSQLDARMLQTLRALARKRGDDPNGVKLPPFVIHDLRRTMRTRLTQLRIPTEVAEATIGHGKKGLERHYNLYEYADERREALALWARRVRSIVEPAPANVVAITRAVS